MASIQVTNKLDDLTRDTKRITVRAGADMTRVVSKNIRKGTALARGFATKTAGRHGHLYPQAIGSEMTSELTGEWGPDANDPGGQGGMSFEGGSRNQPAHHDLANSADIVGPAFGDDVARLADRWFWGAEA